ncbi:MAG: hypothetical protein A2143_00770 [Gallionellales bacterium RBG_16_57_15]|nr:MAG: hypothetical protein A2143_00770 [Gallionellales bacterium RBG_16_57_15]
MKTPRALEIVSGAGLLVTILIAFNWQSISSSSAYQRAFHADEWSRKQQEWAALTIRMDEFNKEACRILIEAREKTLALDVERDVLFGLDRTKSRKRIEHELEIDRMLCAEHGISPYTQREN